MLMLCRCHAAKSNGSSAGALCLTSCLLCPCFILLWKRLQQKVMQQIAHLQRSGNMRHLTMGTKGADNKPQDAAYTEVPRLPVH